MKIISEKRYRELLLKEKSFEESMITKAQKADAVLKALNIKAESAKQIRETLAMEILADEFEMQDKYSKSTFVRTQGLEVMGQVRDLLEQEGILTKKASKQSDAK